MKIKSIMNEVRIPGIPATFRKFFGSFPRDATKWNQATDEMREAAKIVRETYNELQLNLTSDEVEDEGKGIQSLNFRSFKTPSEWNSKAQAFIVVVWNKMKPDVRRETLSILKLHLPQYF